MGVLRKKGLAEKLRKVFENFAHQRNLDPLNPESWYSIPGIVFRTFKVWIESVNDKRNKE